MVIVSATDVAVVTAVFGDAAIVAVFTAAGVMMIEFEHTTAEFP